MNNEFDHMNPENNMNPENDSNMGGVGSVQSDQAQSDAVGPDQVQPESDPGVSGSQYRMKFNGHSDGYNGGPYNGNAYNGNAYNSNAYNSNAGRGGNGWENGGRANERFNEYSYYQNNSQNGQGGGYNYQTFDGGQVPPKPSRKKNKTARQFVKVVCFGLAFGVIAGGAMWGINTLGNRVTQNDAQPDFTIGVVKTSSTDVETIEGQDVSDIVTQAQPSIVAVTTEIVKTTQDFFGRQYSQEGQGAGSGIIFSEDTENNLMYIVTNNHVVADSQQISVTFNDGSSASAEIKGYDVRADIAVLTVDMNDLSDETKAAVKIAVLGDSDKLLPGNGAIAIGNALGYGQSTTTGTISAVNREVQTEDGAMNVIQTDAAINPGNSGGALLNTKGEVIGINTMKSAESNVEGMGFAIPINSALETINDIVSGKLINRTAENTACLGITGATIDDQMASIYNWPVGVMVASVLPESAAENAGIEAGYIITGFNDQEIKKMEELQDMLEDFNPGDKISLNVKIPKGNGVYEDQTIEVKLISIADTPGYEASEQ